MSEVKRYISADAEEIERLRERVRELEDQYAMCCRDRDALAKHESVLAENQRLREALKRIYASGDPVVCVEIAGRALEASDD